MLWSSRFWQYEDVWCWRYLSSWSRLIWRQWMLWHSDYGWRLMYSRIWRCGDIVGLTRDQTALRASCHADCSTSSLLTATVSIQACLMFHHLKTSSNNQLPPIDPLSGSHQIPVPWCATWNSCFLLLPLRQHHFCFKQCTTNKGLGSPEWICMANTSAFNDKGSEKWGVDEIDARDKKLASNLCSQLNK